MCGVARIRQNGMQPEILRERELYVNTRRPTCSEEKRADAQREAEMTQTVHGNGKKRDGKRTAGGGPHCSQMCFHCFAGLSFLSIPL